MIKLEDSIYNLLACLRDATGERQRLPCQVGSVLQNTACSVLYVFLSVCPF